MTPRDSQRQKVYDAEAIAFEGASRAKANAMRLLTIDECQALVDAVFASNYLREKYDFTKDAPTVRRGVGQRRRGCYKVSTNEIHLPEWTRQRWYVLHEVAHALVRPTPTRPAHAQEWAACYLDLLRAFNGRGDHDRLVAAFKVTKVRFKPKRAYTITDAERQRRSERIRALRI